LWKKEHHGLELRPAQVLTTIAHNPPEYRERGKREHAIAL
jgi:hypothetical protein